MPLGLHLKSLAPFLLCAEDVCHLSEDIKSPTKLAMDFFDTLKPLCFALTKKGGSHHANSIVQKCLFKSEFSSKQSSLTLKYCVKKAI